MIKIPFRELSPAALLGVVDEFIHREGTDYGHRDFSLDEKRQAILVALEAGRALIAFDPETRTTTVVETP